MEYPFSQTIICWKNEIKQLKEKNFREYMKLCEDPKFLNSEVDRFNSLNGEIFSMSFEELVENSDYVTDKTYSSNLEYIDEVIIDKLEDLKGEVEKISSGVVNTITFCNIAKIISLIKNEKFREDWKNWILKTINQKYDSKWCNVL